MESTKDHDLGQAKLEEMNDPHESFRCIMHGLPCDKELFPTIQALQQHMKHEHAILLKYDLELGLSPNNGSA